jgi:hypothetical protein
LSDTEVLTRHRYARELFVALHEAQATVAGLREDVRIAAGECLVPVPEPGTDMARLLIANRLLKQRAEAAERELEAWESTRAAIEALPRRQVLDLATTGPEKNQRVERMGYVDAVELAAVLAALPPHSDTPADA